MESNRTARIQTQNRISCETCGQPISLSGGNRCGVCVVVAEAQKQVEEERRCYARRRQEAREAEIMQGYQEPF